MPQSPVPVAKASDGNWRVWFVPDSVSNPLSVAALNGATVYDITYSLTDDGWNFSGSQNAAEDKRLTLPQGLQRPGTFSETGSIKYVDSDETGSAAVVLGPVAGSVNGPSGSFVVRKGIPNATAAATGQKVDVYAGQAGVPLPDAPTTDGRDTIAQAIYLSKPTQRKQALVA